MKKAKRIYTHRENEIHINIILIAFKLRAQIIQDARIVIKLIPIY